MVKYANGPVDFTAKWKRIVELQMIAETAYVEQLKLANPLIADEEIELEVQKWYLDKPEYWPEEFFRPASQERWDRILGKS